MIVAKVRINGTAAEKIYCLDITKGIKGAQVDFEYADTMWNGLTKTIVFRSDKLTLDVVNAGELVTIPAELTANANRTIKVGVYGTNAKGTLVIPTLWVELGKVLDAADPSGDESTDPALAVWAQIQAQIGDLSKLNTDDKETLVAAINEALTKGGGTVDEATIQEIVERYLEEHPPKIDAVLYSAQTLTEEQKAQARANIEVASFKHNNPNIRAINHRGYNTAAPENTLSAFRLSKQMGYKYVECDVCFTSDGVPVLLHDSTVDRTSDGTGSIAEMNYEEVRALDFGSWFSAEYAGEKIPALAEFIILCKQNGLRPYIEIKGGVTAKQAKTLVGIVKRYDMRKNVTWISFSSSSLEHIKTIDNQARLGFVVDAVSENTITTATGLKTDKNEVFIDAYHGGVTNGVITLCVENEIPLEVWTVNTEAKLLAIDPYVSGYTSDNLRANIVLYGADIPEYIPEAPSVRSALIDVDFANSGANIGTGGSAYNATIGNGGAYSGGKFVVNGKGYLSVPAEFMGVSATNPWSIAFKIDSATKSKNTWNRLARGNNDIPAMYVAGSGHETTIHAVQFKAAANFNTGYVWIDDSIIDASGIAYDDSDYSNVFPMVVGFRNDGTYVSIWINGAMVATQLSTKYQQMATSFQIGDGGLQNYDPGSLECSMLKLWNEALTDEEMAAVTLLQ